MVAVLEMMRRSTWSTLAPRTSVKPLISFSNMISGELFSNTIFWLIVFVTERLAQQQRTNNWCHTMFNNRPFIVQKFNILSICMSFLLENGKKLNHKTLALNNASLLCYWPHFLDEQVCAPNSMELHAPIAIVISLITDSKYVNKHILRFHYSMLSA